MRHIRDVLNEINNTWRYPEEILLCEAMTGYRNNMRECPIARYLKANADPVEELEVDETVVWYENGELQMFTFYNVQVIAFMINFDKGEYPELEVR
jgi:hypothetical protein